MGGPTASRFRLLVVDDHEIVLWGLRLLLTRERWVERCVTALTGEQALALARRFEPHVAVVDVFLREESGVDVARAIRDESARTKVVLMSGGARMSAKAIRAAGASGFVSKAWHPDDLARAVRVVGLGVNLTVPGPGDDKLDRTRLTAREMEVLRLIADGATNARIAVELSLSLHTVKQHVSTILSKLKVRNRAEAVTLGQRLGYLE